MATLMTGTLPFVHGIRSLAGYKLDPNVATLAEILRHHGYHTRAEATGPVVMQTGFDRGFDVFHHRDGDTTLYVEEFWNELQQAMEDLPADRPWFFYLHLWEMHHPRYVPKEFDRPEWGVHRYERALSALDALRLPRILELAGDATVVAVTGDHGEVPRFDRALAVTSRLKLRPLYRFLNRRSNHGYHLYEDLVLVPLLLRGPGIPQGRRLEWAIRHIDLFPTFLDAAGIEDPRAGQAIGQSLMSSLVGKGEDLPGYAEAVGISMGGPDRWLLSVRHDGWKYVKRVTGAGAWLWRLPDERRDVAAENPDVIREMEAILEGFRAGMPITATGEDLSDRESVEVEDHLRRLGYIE
jgi:arylsulfatase A-like enzyme